MLINYSEKIKQFNKKIVEKFDLHLHKMFADKLASNRPYPIKKFDAFLHKTFNIDYPMRYTYVDLGLPSGTLWATFNIGATKPEEIGDYFAWGETSTRKLGQGSYSIDDYTYSDLSAPEELPTSADAAYVNWGSNWRIPSKLQIEELINNEYTTTEWIEKYHESSGVLITSKFNNNSIFLPATGRREYNVEYENVGFYLSNTYTTSTPTNNYALAFGSNGIDLINNNLRYYGIGIRPVYSNSLN